MYKYNIFGLKTNSNIPLGCYKEDFQIEDVTIIINELSAKVDSETGFRKFSKNFAEFIVEDTCRIEISDGKLICVYPQEGVSNKELELYILGTSFGTLMVQRNEYPIHGSFIMHNSLGIGLVGDSGAGKTTLASGFSKLGSKIITDDVMRIDYYDGVPYVHPSYPSQKIWKESAKNLNINIDGMEQINNRFEKYYYTGEERFHKEKNKLNIIVDIVPDDVEEVTIEKLSKQKSLDVLMKNTYRYVVIDYTQRHLDHLIFLTKLISDVEVYRIKRPKVGFTIEKQIGLITETIGGENHGFYKK